MTIYEKRMNKANTISFSEFCSVSDVTQHAKHFHLLVNKTSVLFMRPQPKTYVFLVDCVSCAIFLSVVVVARQFLSLFSSSFLVLHSQFRFILSRLMFHKQTSTCAKITHFYINTEPHQSMLCANIPRYIHSLVFVYPEIS